MILILCLLQLIFIAMVWMVYRKVSTTNKVVVMMNRYIQDQFLKMGIAAKEYMTDYKIELQMHGHWESEVSHDLQQIKTRLHWSRERELEYKELVKDYNSLKDAYKFQNRQVKKAINVIKKGKK